MEDPLDWQGLSEVFALECPEAGHVPSLLSHRCSQPNTVLARVMLLAWALTATEFVTMAASFSLLLIEAHASYNIVGSQRLTINGRNKQNLMVEAGKYK